MSEGKGIIAWAVDLSMAFFLFRIERVEKQILIYLRHGTKIAIKAGY